jgi:hypothetical protein
VLDARQATYMLLLPVHAIANAFLVCTPDMPF